jgi:hypothetical protein
MAEQSEKAPDKTYFHTGEAGANIDPMHHVDETYEANEHYETKNCAEYHNGEDYYSHTDEHWRYEEYLFDTSIAITSMTAR